MSQNSQGRHIVPDGEKADAKDSSLLPMLLGGLALIVIGAGVVMTVV